MQVLACGKNQHSTWTNIPLSNHKKETAKHCRQYRYILLNSSGNTRSSTSDGRAGSSGSNLLPRMFLSSESCVVAKPQYSHGLLLVAYSGDDLGRRFLCCFCTVTKLFSLFSFDDALALQDLFTGLLQKKLSLLPGFAQYLTKLFEIFFLAIFCLATQPLKPAILDFVFDSYLSFSEHIHALTL